MRRPLHCAFRYHLAGPDETLDPGGFEVDRSGHFAMLSGAASVRQAILLLLSTRRGERLGRPTYGCDLHELAFAPNDDTTAGLAIHMVRQAIDEWEPRAEIVRLDVVQNGGELELQLEYRLAKSEHRDAIVLPLAKVTGES